MVRSKEAILEIIQAGGNIIIEDDSNRNKETLLEIARAAATKKVKVTILKCDRYPVDTLVAVAEAGEGYITFGI